MLLQSQTNLDAAKQLQKAGKSALNSPIVLCIQLSVEHALKSMIFLKNRETYYKNSNSHSLTELSLKSHTTTDSVEVLAKKIESLGNVKYYNYKGRTDDLSIRARYAKFHRRSWNSQIIPTTMPDLTFKDVDINDAIRFNFQTTL